MSDCEANSDTEQECTAKRPSCVAKEEEEPDTKRQKTETETEPEVEEVDDAEVIMTEEEFNKNLTSVQNEVDLSSVYVNLDKPALVKFVEVAQCALSFKSKDTVIEFMPEGIMLCSKEKTSLASSFLSHHCFLEYKCNVHCSYVIPISELKRVMPKISDKDILEVTIRFDPNSSIVRLKISGKRKADCGKLNVFNFFMKLEDTNENCFVDMKQIEKEVNANYDGIISIPCKEISSDFKFLGSSKKIKFESTSDTYGWKIIDDIMGSVEVEVEHEISKGTPCTFMLDRKKVDVAADTSKLNTMIDLQFNPHMSDRPVIFKSSINDQEPKSYFVLVMAPHGEETN